MKRGKYEGGRSCFGRKRCRKFGTWVLIILAVSSVSFGGVTLARYLATRSASNTALAQRFYFTSNYLRPVDEGAQYNIYGESVNITLKNTDGINSTNAIVYKLYKGKTFVSEHCPTNTPINGFDGSLLSGPKATNVYKLDGAAGTRITVTATSLWPYEKQLTATFTFVDPGENSFYEVTDEGYVVTLDIKTGRNHPNTLTINYVGLIPDRAAGITKNWPANATSYTLALEANAHYVLTFFDESNGAANNFMEQNELPDMLTLRN